MKKITLCIIALLAVCAASVKAQQNNIVSEHALVWRITGNGLKQPSYIMGTMHEEHWKILDHVAGFQEAWDYTQQIALESIGESSNPKRVGFFKIDSLVTETDSLPSDLKTKNLPSDYYLPENVTYDSLLTPKQVETLKTRNASLYEKMPRINPQYLSDVLTISLWYSAANHYIFNVKNNIKSDDYSIQLDTYLENKASQEKKNVLGLEEPIHYTVFMTGNPNSESLSLKQKALILYKKLLLSHSEYAIALSCDTVYYNHAPELIYNINNYERSAMYNLLKEENELPYLTEEENVSYMDSIYFKGNEKIYRDRNEQWMKKIPQIIKKKPTLIAVGFAHVVRTIYDEGLVSRLREMGYTLTPIVYKGENEPLHIKEN